MLSMALFLATVFALPVLCAAIGTMKIEYALPVGCLSIVVVLYLFGLFGILKAGVYVVVFAAVFSYAFSLFFVYKKGKYRAFIGYFKNFEVFFVIAAGVMIAICDYGKMAIRTDEFSHWMDAVKVMSIYDDFITNPKSDSLYQSYPPAMALFQFYFQKLTQYVDRTKEFNEWRMYYAFHLLCISCMLPLFKKAAGGLYWILCAAVILILPQVFFNRFYADILIDPFVMILGAVGFVIVLLYDGNKKGVYYYFVSLICFVLVLVKDIGLFFSIFIGISFFIIEWIHEMKNGTVIYKRFLAVLPIVCGIIAKVTWYVELIFSHANIRMRTLTIDVIGYSKMFFFGGGDFTYRQKVINNSNFPRQKWDSHLEKSIL